MKTLTIKYSEYQQRGIRNVFELFGNKLTEAGFDLKKPMTWTPFDFLCDITFTQPEGVVVEAGLDLVPSDVLLDEVFKRFDVSVFEGLKKLNETGGYERSRRYRGNRHIAISLAGDLHFHLHAE